MLTFVATAFLGGLILNFMPCVFPVISLKVLSVVRHAQNPRGVRIEGMAYLAGVVVTMLLLAGALLAARAGGAAIGWGFQLQSPVVIAILALVMLGSALNLMGLFEVGAVAQRAGNLALPQHGPWGAALTGALAIIVATPCTAPFMAGAVGFAVVQPPLAGMTIFLALAVGFAAPFVLISLFPALARVLPRPGSWMGILKHVLAFPMLGAAAWLAWVLDRQAGSSALGTLLAAAVLLGFGAWLYGLAWQQRLRGGRHHRLLMAGVALVAVGLVAMLASLPGTAQQTGSEATSAGPQDSDAPVVWSPQKVQELRGKGKPIFVNFTASWCITCQVNEHSTLSTQSFKDAMRKNGAIYMVADSTKYNADIDHAINQFARGGLPVYVVYPADGGEPAVLPQILSPAIVATALEQAVKKSP